MSFNLLPPEEQAKRYARERRRTFELRKHLKNTTRLLVLERGWLYDARNQAAAARMALAEEKRKQHIAATARSKPSKAVFIAFVLGAAFATILWMISR